MFEKLFHLKEEWNQCKNRDYRRYYFVLFTMAYIIFVNPQILSAAGMDAGAVMLATCIASAIGTFLMAFLTNYPFALAPGMGLNAFFAFTICGSMGYSWQAALAAVFISGCLFIIITVTGVREAIVRNPNGTEKRNQRWYWFLYRIYRIEERKHAEIYH